MKKILRKSDKKLNWKWTLFVSALLLFCVFCLYNADYKGVALCSENIKADEPIGGIYSDHALTQYIESKNDKFAGFEICFGTYGRTNNNQVKVTLSQESKTLYTWNFNANVLVDNKYTLFMLPKALEKTKGTMYKITIETNSSKEDNGNNVTVYSTLDKDSISDATLYENGTLSDGTLAIKTVHGYIQGRWMLVAAILIVILVMGTALYCAIKKDMPLERKYILLASVIGIIYLFVLPYGVGPDEHKHMLRIFEVSEGHVISEHGINGAGGRTMPGNLVPCDKVDSYSELSNYWDVSLNYEKAHFYTFGNTALYSPISYLPQVAGVAIIKLFTNHIVWIFYSAKLAGLLFVLGMLYLALKYLPFKKECLLLIAFLPMFLQQSVVVTADSFLNGVAIAFTAYILYLRYRYQGMMTKRQIAIIFIAMILLGLCKVVFLPLCILPFMIPVEKFGSKSKFWGILLTALGIACVINLIWLSISSGYLYEIREGINSGDQVKFVLSHPLSYFNVLYKTLLVKHEIIFWEFFGDGLGALSIPINRFGYYFYAGLFAVFAVAKSEEDIIKLKDRLIMILAAVGSVLLIFTSEYVQWTTVAADVVDGVQGRYFFPVILLFFLFLSNRNVSLGNKDKLESYIFPFVGYINVFAIISCICSLVG